MGYLEREMTRLSKALVDGGHRHAELYAAQQALAWALKPNGFASPLQMLTGTQGDSEDCSVAPRPPQS
jgi:hypothetical protein